MEQLLRQARLLVSPAELLVPEAEPNLKAHNDLLAQLVRDRDHVKAVRAEHPTTNLELVERAQDAAITSIEAISKDLIDSQLDTFEFPLFQTRTTSGHCSLIGDVDRRARAALAENERRVRDVLKKIHAVNEALADAVGRARQLDEKIAKEHVELKDPTFTTKDPATGKWKAWWWKRDNRFAVEKILALRRDAWTGRGDTMALAAQRIGLLGDLLDLLQDRFEIVKSGSSAAEINALAESEPAANAEAAKHAQHWKALASAAKADLDAIVGAEARAVAAHQAALANARALDDASDRRIAELMKQMDALEEERRRLREDQLRELEIQVDAGDIPPDPDVQRIEAEIEAAKKRLAQLESDLEAAKATWMEREAERRRQLYDVAREAETNRRAAVFFAQSKGLDEQLTAIHHELLKEEVHKDERRQSELAREQRHAELLAAIARHGKRLQNTVRNTDIAVRYVDALDKSAHNLVQALAMGQTDLANEIGGTLVLGHRSISDIYVELYVSHGLSLYEKESHLDEIHDVMGITIKQLDFCVETHDPNAHKHLAIYTELDAMNKQLVLDVNNLPSNMESLLAEFEATAVMLRANAVGYFTPTEALRAALENPGTQLPPVDPDMAALIRARQMPALLPLAHLGRATLALDVAVPEGALALVERGRGATVLSALTPNAVKESLGANRRVRDPCGDPNQAPSRINLQPARPVVFDAARFTVRSAVLPPAGLEITGGSPRPFTPGSPGHGGSYGGTLVVSGSGAGQAPPPSRTVPPRSRYTLVDAEK